VSLLLLLVCGVLHAEDQPIPFSHKQHTKAGIKCQDCHTLKKPGFAAGIPGEQTCMGCHATIKKDSEAIQKLAGYAKAKKSVPWVRLYRLPDYVWFSHAVHHQEANIACEICHGPVAEREVMSKEKPITMVACMECHKQNKAPNGCTVCHDTR
jgi:Cytochrome c7 and related cytochrome c/Cytochrome c3